VTRLHREDTFLTFIDKECLHNRRGVSKPSCLDDDSIKLIHSLVKPLECLHKITSNGAADASVHHLNYLLIDRFGDDLVVNADFSKFILDDGEFHAMGSVVEDVVEEGGLAC
jgi:hypothetical protein